MVGIVRVAPAADIKLSKKTKEGSFQTDLKNRDDSPPVVFLGLVPSNLVYLTIAVSAK